MPIILSGRVTLLGIFRVVGESASISAQRAIQNKPGRTELHKDFYMSSINIATNIYPIIGHPEQQMKQSPSVPGSARASTSSFIKGHESIFCSWRWILPYTITHAEGQFFDHCRIIMCSICNRMTAGEKWLKKDHRINLKWRRISKGGLDPAVTTFKCGNSMEAELVIVNDIPALMYMTLIYSSMAWNSVPTHKLCFIPRAVYVICYVIHY